MTVAEKPTTKHFLSTKNLPLEDLKNLFSKARLYKSALDKNTAEHFPKIEKTLVNLFLEPSTRTRVSFEIAAKKLGAQVVNIESATSSLTKGESLIDTALNLQALYADALIIRNKESGSASMVAQHLNIPVINAGDGTNEHPTQALLDAFTITEHFRTLSLSGLTIAIVGDIAHSRVAGSNIPLLQTLGAKIILVGPESWIPSNLANENVSISDDLESALKVADVAMFLRIQTERHANQSQVPLDYYVLKFSMNQSRLSWLKKDAVIMHPGPINEDIELDAHCIRSDRSLILQQVSNGVAVRMAVIESCLGH